MGQLMCTLQNTCSDSVQLNTTFLFGELCHTKPYNSKNSYVNSNSINTPTLPITFDAVQFMRGYVQAPIAIIAFNDATKVFTKIQYWIETDRYTLVEITDTNLDTYFDPKLTIKVEFGRYTTPALHRAEVVAGGTHYVATYWNVNINLRRGVVSDVSWDNSCSDCPNSFCIYGEQCAVDVAACRKDLSCNFKFYISWTGDDKDGTMLTSSRDS
uniref:Uncharacterized protein n=1 Tax=Lygus hesperus TaxID=30085 RepID=A0A0A9WJ88_LYGHE